MSASGIAIGIVIGVPVMVGMALYTNILQVTRPEIETSINYAKDTISKVLGKDVVLKAEEISSSMKSAIVKVKIQNPLGSTK